MPVRRPSAPSRPALPPTQESTRVIVPKQNKDPIWSLRPWPIVLAVGGRDFDVPAMVATDWLVYLMADPMDIDGLIEEIIPDLDKAIYELEIDLGEAYFACLDLITTVAARSWWIAARLVYIAAQSWHVIGPKLIDRGADPNTLSLAAWLDVLLVTVLDNMDPKDTTMFVMKLEAAPATESAPEEEMEMDRDAFLSMGG